MTSSSLYRDTSPEAQKRNRRRALAMAQVKSKRELRALPAKKLQSIFEAADQLAGLASECLDTAGETSEDRSRRLARERQRKHRSRQKAAKRAAAVETVAPELSPIAIKDPVGALATWARDRLIVPPGHPNAGQPMELPDFAEAFLRESWEAHESAMSMARKNAKSAIAAILALGYLDGPLAFPGFRAAIASVSKDKAAELRDQVAAIIRASRLTGLTIRASPYPGEIRSATGRLQVLSADRSAGHASGFDLVICDETGLFPDRSRELLAGLRTSVSAKGGRIMHISIKGDSPLFREILANPESVAHVYAAQADADIADEAAWRDANPGLGSIKSLDYMRAELARVIGNPPDEPYFRAHDLNQAQDPTKEMILPRAIMEACFVEEPPPRRGDAYLGLDFGEATSGTAACAIWPTTGRVETWLAFGDNPKLEDRARRDSAPYVEMQRRGELRTYPGRIVPPGQFLTDVSADLAGVRIAGAAADSYKDSETKDFLDRANLRWPIQFRRVGAGRDGGRDVRAFQRLIHERRLRMARNVSLLTAISKATIRRDGNQNPGLDKSTSRSRIDVLSAAVIAGGLAEPIIFRKKKPRRLRHFVVG